MYEWENMDDKEMKTQRNVSNILQNPLNITMFKVVLGKDKDLALTSIARLIIEISRTRNRHFRQKQLLVVILMVKWR